MTDSGDPPALQVCYRRSFSNKAGMFSGGGKFCIVGQSKRMSDAWVCGSEALDVLYFAEAALD